MEKSAIVDGCDDETDQLFEIHEHLVTKKLPIPLFVRTT